MTRTARTIEVSTHDEEGTRALARSLASLLRGGEVIGLDGPLGAGKTTFVRGLAEGLGVSAEEVSSPTFVLCHEYVAPTGRTLVHVDAYRIGDLDELETFGFDELLADAGSIVVVEWAARIAGSLPRDRITVTLAHAGAHERSIAISAAPELVEALDPTAVPAPARCPICSAPASPDHAPFCGSRCRMVDLGRWFKGDYHISRPIREDDEGLG